MPISFSSLASSKVQKTVMITSTQSWTAPIGVASIEVILCGGGGGGSTNSPGQGGCGSVFYRVLTVSPGTAYTITIGAGGSGGNLGSDSTFGALFTATAASWYNGAGLGGGGGSPSGNSSYPSTPGAIGAYGYGGGGGGGGGGSYAAGGSSGGGAGGGNGILGQNASANSGSGGGGYGASGGAGAGGSGICIIKYWA